LPQMEQQAYYSQLNGPNFNIPNPWSNPGSWPTPSVVALPFLTCTSDPGDEATSLTGTPVLPKSNYLGIFSGLKDADDWNVSFPSNQRALFQVGGKGTRFADITD